MGGNVFKDYLSQKEEQFVGRRLESEDYPSALFAVKSILDKIGLSYATIDFVREKESHGDLDIIVERHPDISAHDITSFLENEGFKVSQNSNSIVSFLLLTFQVDLILIDPESVDYARNYFSWNDLGNLIGRVSKQVGLKHGHDGLYFMLREEDRVLKEYKLTNDYFKVLEILELDVKHFKKGFNTYIEMFEWVSASPYFNPNKFLLENLNNRNRVRDRKRVIYNLFLNWLNTKEFSPPRIVDDKEQFVFNLFPGLEEDCKAVRDRAEMLKLLRAKIDVNFIIEFTGLTGKDLGGFLTSFKSKYDEKYILNSTIEELRLTIKSFYEGYSNL